MTVMNDEDPADPSGHEPRVSGSPARIWLIYGDIEGDATHADCCASGEVTWCEDSQFVADVCYVRADLYELEIAVALAARDYFTRYGQDEADDVTGEDTGCGVQQHNDALRLRDALSAARYMKA